MYRNIQSILKPCLQIYMYLDRIQYEYSNFHVGAAAIELVRLPVRLFRFSISMSKEQL